MSRFLTGRRLVSSWVVALLFGVGCGSSGSGCGGCSGFRPLPKDSSGNYSPAPFGLPADQIVEGGLQARITKPGMDKILSLIPSLINSLLGSGACLPKGSIIGINYCDTNSCSGGAQGCPAYIYVNSKDRPGTTTPSPLPPTPKGDDDGKDKIVVTLQDSSTSTEALITMDMYFDALIPIHTNNGITQCTFYARTDHLANDSADPLHVSAGIKIDIDPTTGEIVPSITTVSIPNLSVGTDATGGILCTIGSGIANAVLDVVNALGFIKDLIINSVVTPALNNAIGSLLPKPLGLAGVADTGTLLSSLSPPANAGLELFVVPGGYIQSKAGGLTLGVMAGINSDANEATRTPGLASEPSTCVPARPTPVLSQMPWNLPFNVGRKDYTLNPANQFAGNPDPVDANGKVQDVAIGLSRTFLDLAGFHLYNSGTMCLHIGGSTIQQLNAGTLAVLITSLNNVIEDKQAPLELVLRPQTPLTFTIGTGTKDDPLIHIGVNDLRIDFYGWIEERWVRLLTVGLDLNLGINLTTTMTADGKPAIQPTILGLEAKNVTARVSNTDILHEMPADLAAAFPDLLGIVASALGGALGPIALPSVAGFSLDNVQIQRVQTSMDDFVGIYAGITTGSPAPLLNWSDPAHPYLVGGVRTEAQIVGMNVPKQAELQALYANNGAVAARPSVTLALDAGDKANRPVEFAYRVDHGMWHDWSQDAHPTITDQAFLLQGHHTIEVRSRVVGQWNTEDPTPVAMDALIDSVAPELHPALDESDRSLVRFNGFDVVTPKAQLKYAWRGADGRPTEWSSTDSIPQAQLVALTNGGTQPFIVYAQDEAGNVGQTAVDASTLGFHGRTTSAGASGCKCDIGGAGGDGNTRGTLLALALMALVFLWRRTRTTAAALSRKVGALVVVAAVSFFAVGCGCDSNNGKGQCKVDDDCSKMQCDKGQVPTCTGTMCGCTPDLAPGDVGRYSSMAVIGGSSYVSAYNNTWGDLMVGHVTPSGIVSNWDFVDGVPASPPDLPNSHVRGGIMDPGDDVGRYTSIGASSSMQPIVAYYDRTHGALKFASFGGITWHTYAIDKGTGSPMSGGDDIGRWPSMTVGADGKPGIAYSAWVQMGTSGMPESQLRWAQAKTNDPQSPADWDIVVLDSRLQSSDGSPPSLDMAVGPDMTMPGGDMATGPDMATKPHELLPEGIALMASAARKADGTPGIAYYDRTRGNLRYIEYQTAMNAWGKPVILDGEDGKNNDLGDVGLYNSLIFDDNGIAHISYENATMDSLLYINTMAKLREVVDDGYHPADESTGDGLDSPVWHLVGDSSSIAVVGGRALVAYQDSTVVELRLAQRNADGTWMKQYVAGHGMGPDFKGSYGFYANLRMTAGGHGVLSSYAIDQRPEIPVYFVEVFPVDLGLIE